MRWRERRVPRPPALAGKEESMKGRGVLMTGAALLAAMAAAAGPGWAQTAPHVHGVVALQVAIDGPRVVLTLKAPLDSLVGFERAPRTDAERRVAADALARLREPDDLFRLDAPAACRRVSVQVEAPVLEARPAAGAAAASRDGHADLAAEIVYECGRPEALKALEVGLADRFKRTRRVEVEVVGPRGQSKTTLRGAARQVRLDR
jgi:hypothetical protein